MANGGVEAVEGEGGGMGKEEGIPDLDGWEKGLANDEGELGVEGGWEKKEAEEVLEEGNEKSVDEIDV